MDELNNSFLPAGGAPLAGDPLAHVAFPKIPRLSRDAIITEKIDGTCGCILVTEQGDFKVGSKNRWLEPGKQDNHGFANWAFERKTELIKELGPGRHFGEWWGNGIQRGYGCAPGERYFSLFNVLYWEKKIAVEGRALSLCLLVPVLYRGPFDVQMASCIMEQLRINGSSALPGFMNPEGVVIQHVQSRRLFKKTFVGDECGKGNAE